MRQPAYPVYLIYAPQRYFNSDTPQKRLCTEMRTGDGRCKTQLRKDSRGY